MTQTFALQQPVTGLFPFVRLLLAANVCSLSLAATAGELRMSVTKADGSPATDTVVAILPLGPWPIQPAPGVAVVNQKDLRFAPYVTAVPVGTVLRLTNLDRYDHHVRSMPTGPLGNVPPASSFEFRLPPGKDKDSSAEVKLDSPGSITLGCHIHGSMRGHVYVSNSPWLAVTDEQGQVVLKNIPDGAAELRLWHPDQLSEQAVKRVQLSASTLELAGSLNFSPRKRRVATPSGTSNSSY